MTIHSDHPFVPPERDRSLGRRLRGRLPAPVAILTTGVGRERVGLTVSSLLIVDGEPVQLIAMVDPDSELGESIELGTRVAVSLCAPGDEFLADAFAGIAPAPGGLFTLGSWEQTEFGPSLADHSWVGAQVTQVRELGWYLEVLAELHDIHLTDKQSMGHHRGRYFGVPEQPKTR